MTAGEQLIRLLDLEHKLITQGAFEALEPLLERKERLSQDLLREDIGEAVLAKIRQKSEGNGLLLEAAARGIRAALSQVEDAISMAEQSTYDHHGQKQKLSKRRTSLERKV